MPPGFFITFSLSTREQHERRADDKGNSARRAKELEISFARSHATQHVWAKANTAANVSEQKLRRKWKAQRSQKSIGRRPTIPTVAPSLPFRTALERLAIDFYLSRTTLFLGRDRNTAGSVFWNVTVPQLAWSYPSVKYALVALSLGTQSLVHNVAERLAPNTMSRETLKHQNMAIRELLDSTTVPFVTVVVAVVFRAICLVMGDRNGAYRQSKAALDLIQNMSYESHADLGLIKRYVQTVFEADCSSLWSPTTNSLEYSQLLPGASPLALRPMLSRKGDEAVISGETDASSERERQFFHCLVQLAVARGGIRQLYDHVHAPRRDVMLAQSFPSQVDDARIRAFVSLMFENIDWLHGRWSSASYLAIYLNGYLARRLRSLHMFLDNMNMQAEPSVVAAIQQASSKPFLGTLEELNIRLGASNAVSTGTASRPQIGRTTYKTSFEELAGRLVEQGHALLAETAGNEPRLRRDIIEMIITGWHGGSVEVEVHQDTIDFSQTAKSNMSSNENR
jgi:hypothetical protein